MLITSPHVYKGYSNGSMIKTKKKTYEKILKYNKGKEVICLSYDKGLYASLIGKVKGYWC